MKAINNYSIDEVMIDKSDCYYEAEENRFREAEVVETEDLGEGRRLLREMLEKRYNALENTRKVLTDKV